MRQRGHRYSSPWVHRHPRWEPILSWAQQKRGYATASDPRVRRTRTEFEWILHHLHQGQWGPIQLRRHIQILPTSHHSNNPGYAGSGVCHSWGYCCLYLETRIRDKRLLVQPGDRTYPNPAHALWFCQSR